MTRAFRPSRLVWKEARALAPFWLMSAAPLALGAVSGTSVLVVVSLAGYPVGAATLGAMSVGHEYAHDTLAQLLSLPVSRRRLLGTKAAVLATAVSTLGLLAAVALLSLVRREPASPVAAAAVRAPLLWTMLALPLIMGLTVAPWLTMLCRSAIGGVVFTLAAPAALWALAGAVAASQDTLDDTGYRVVMLAALWTGTAALAALGAVAGRRAFLRLDAAGAHGEFDTTEWIRQRSATSAGVLERRPGHPVAALLRKELRLQSVTFMVAALYVVAWVITWVTGERSRGGLMSAITVVYTLFVPAMIGAIASAEERALGTIEWQVLQPFSNRKQWTVKIAVAAAAAAVLTIGVPLLLVRLMPPGAGTWRFDPTTVPQMLVMAAIAGGTLYVSSLSTGGLRALLLAFPFAGAGAAAVFWIVPATRDALWRALDIPALLRDAAARGEVPWSPDVVRWASPYGGRAAIWFAAAATAGLIWVLLRFAFLNHHSTDRARPRVTRQVAWIGTYVVAGAIVGAAISPIALWLLAKR